ncbi:MAG: SEC-C metal-binding domain-containing protein [Candidatus Micrarchaeota archaeon]
MKGPCLEPGQYQSGHSDALLELFKQYLVTDERYVARLKRHYEMFKAKVREIAGKQRLSESAGRESVPKAGRNDSCPCGSGKKYKKCCLKQ